MLLFSFIGLPPGVGEVLLLALFVGFFALSVRQVRRRRQFAPVGASADVALPDLNTLQRLTGNLRRTWRDPEQQVWLAEVTVGRRRFTFCATDHETRAEEYTRLAQKGATPADVAVYALATLVPGGADTMRDQIKDAGKVPITPDLVRLISVGDAPGQVANDYAVIGRILSHRDDTISGLDVTVYRTQVINGDNFILTLELAVQKTDTPPFPEGSMVHGSARLYGSLA